MVASRFWFSATVCHQTGLSSRAQLRPSTCTVRKIPEKYLVHSKQPHNIKQCPQTSTENVCIDSGSKHPQMLQNAVNPQIAEHCSILCDFNAPRGWRQKTFPLPSVQPLSHGFFTVAQNYSQRQSESGAPRGSILLLERLCSMMLRFHCQAQQSETKYHVLGFMAKSPSTLSSSWSSHFLFFFFESICLKH